MLAVVFAAAAVLLAPAAAQAAYPGADGRFLYSDAGGLKSTISALDPATGKTNVVAQKTTGHAAVAGDGRTVAFIRYQGGGIYAIWTADIDGGGERMVIDGFNFLTDIAISRDGSKIAFTGTDLLGPRPVTAGLYVVNTDGTDVHIISGFTGSGYLGVGANNAAQPVFSPDGSKVAFVGGDGDFLCGKEYLGGDGDIYEARVDGSGERRVASDPRRSESLPSYSPDGKRIAFQRPEYVGGECPSRNEERLRYFAVWSMRADGRGDDRLLFRGKTGDLDGRPRADTLQYLFYAPSGSRVAFWLNEEMVTVSAEPPKRSKASKPKKIRGLGLKENRFPLDWGPRG